MRVTWDKDAAVYVARSHDFPVTTQGRTVEEATTAFIAAVTSYLEAHKERGTTPAVKRQ